MTGRDPSNWDHATINAELQNYTVSRTTLPGSNVSSEDLETLQTRLEEDSVKSKSFLTILNTEYLQRCLAVRRESQPVLLDAIDSLRRRSEWYRQRERANTDVRDVGLLPRKGVKSVQGALEEASFTHKNTNNALDRTSVNDDEPVEPLSSPNPRRIVPTLVASHDREGDRTSLPEMDNSKSVFDLSEHVSEITRHVNGNSAIVLSNDNTGRASTRATR